MKDSVYSVDLYLSDKEYSIEDKNCHAFLNTD
jgi:hypothetical protein